MWVPAGVRLWFAGNVIEMDEVQIGSGRSSLPGELTVPSGAVGIVVFAHGSGSSRLSPRNVAVARAALEEVTAPTLLIVGSEDPVVVEVNREAFQSLRCEKRLEVIPGAGHLFGEPGALERVAELAGDWFFRHF